MGDKSPKAIHKKNDQKQNKVNMELAKKKAAEAAKQSANEKK